MDNESSSNEYNDEENASDLNSTMTHKLLMTTMMSPVKRSSKSWACWTITMMTLHWIFMMVIRMIRRWR
jgi:hypothetical protein